MAVMGTGTIRLRLVPITALAMIIYTLLMELGRGDAGGVQPALLGRAVIGGPVLATFATLLIAR